MDLDGLITFLILAGALIFLTGRSMRKIKEIKKGSIDCGQSCDSCTHARPESDKRNCDQGPD